LIFLFQFYEDDKFNLSPELITRYNIHEGTLNNQDIFYIVVTILVVITYGLNFKGIFYTICPDSLLNKYPLVHKNVQVSLYLANSGTYTLFLMQLYKSYEDILKNKNIEDIIINIKQFNFIRIGERRFLNINNKPLKFSGDDIKFIKLAIIILSSMLILFIPLVFVCFNFFNYYLSSGYIYLIMNIYLFNLYLLAEFFSKIKLLHLKYKVETYDTIFNIL